MLGLSNDRHRINAGGNIEKGKNYKFDGDKTVRPSQYDREVFSSWFMDLSLPRIMKFHSITTTKDTGHTGTPSLPMDIYYIRTNIGSISYNGKLADNLDVRFKGFFNRGRHMMSNHLLRDAPRPGGGNQRFREATPKLQSGGYNLHFIVPELHNGKLIVGFDGDVTVHDSVISDVTNSMFFIDNFVDSTKNRYSAFSEWNGEVATDLNLEVGFRYTYVDMDSNQVDATPVTYVTPRRSITRSV